MAEVVATTGAYQGSLPGTSPRSDCKAGISAIPKLLVRKAAGGKRPKGPQSLITTFLLKPHNLRSLTWITAHSELNKDMVGRFEDEDYGIYFADRVAGNESLTSFLSTVSPFGKSTHQRDPSSAYRGGCSH